MPRRSHNAVMPVTLITHVQFPMTYVDRFMLTMDKRKHTHTKERSSYFYQNQIKFATVNPNGIYAALLISKRQMQLLSIIWIVIIEAVQLSTDNQTDCFIVIDIQMHPRLNYMQWLYYNIPFNFRILSRCYFRPF